MSDWPIYLYVTVFMWAMCNGTPLELWSAIVFCWGVIYALSHYATS